MIAYVNTYRTSSGAIRKGCPHRSLEKAQAAAERCWRATGGDVELVSCAEVEAEQFRVVSS